MENINQIKYPIQSTENKAGTTMMLMLYGQDAVMPPEQKVKQLS